MQARNQSFAHFPVLLLSYANSGSSPPVIKGSTFVRLRKQLKESGERVINLEIAPRIFRWYVMLKESGSMIVTYDDKDTLYNPMTNTRLADLEDNVPWSRDLDKRTLSDDEVLLPGSIKKLFGWECDANLQPRYGYSEQ